MKLISGIIVNPRVLLGPGVPSQKPHFTDSPRIPTGRNTMPNDVGGVGKQPN